MVVLILAIAFAIYWGIMLIPSAIIVGIVSLIFGFPFTFTGVAIFAAFLAVFDWISSICSD